MPRVCTICTHPERAAINAALVAGTPLRNIAERHGVSATALHRHKEEHVPATLVKAHEAEDVRQALDIVAQLKAINGAALTVLGEARRSGNGELALKAIDRIQRQIELQAKLLGELDERPQVNVLVAAPEWLAVRGAIFTALTAYPEARAAVAHALAAGEAGEGGTP